MPRIIVVDEERCLACRSCEIQCAMAHSEFQTLSQAVTAPVPPQARVHVEPVGQYGMPLQCRHCQDAPCMMVCPTDALHRPDQSGPVLVDAASCIGCKSCMLVCPFGVIDLSRDGKATIKCDLCIERTAAGKEPACVAGCPTKALKFAEVDEHVRDRRRAAATQLASGANQARKVASEDRGGR